MQGTQTALREGRRPKSRRGWIILGGLLGALFLGIWIWWRGLTAMPNITIPSPTLPTPNGFDSLVQASNALQEDKAIGEAMSTRPIVGQKVYTQAEKEALVAKNAEPLKQLRATFAQEYWNPPSRSFNTLFPYYAKFRGMARLLVLESRVYASRGDWGRALQCDLDAIRLGLTVPRGAPLIGDLVGIACEAIGRRGAWEAVDKLTAAEAKAAARDLELLLEKRLPFADTLQEEKWGVQGALMEVFRNPNWRTSSDFLGLGDAEEDGMVWKERLSNIPATAHLHLYSNAAIMKNFTGYMDAQIARARQPYAIRSAPPPIPPDLVNQILAPVFSQADNKALVAETQSALLLTALALRAYRAEHGHYPAKLDALVPAILSKLPADPFGTQGFRYQHQGNKYLLYSVGPDKQDDGGTPIDDPSRASGSNTNARYFINPDSRGDVVVGVNKY
jgi:type II secretory pathway pseudopilin PulG